MRKPEYLKAGDRIRIVSPAGSITKEKVLPAVDLLRQQGFDVILGDHVFDRHFQFSATDSQRLADLQLAFDDPECKAVICSRGGYGTIRIAGRLDFSMFNRYPKWLVGFSDITILHACVQHAGFCSVHGAMPGFYVQEGKVSQSFLELMTLLKGEGISILFPSNKLNRTGSAAGKLVGGNLSLLYSLIGTPVEPETDDNILFIEDISEYLYHLDRMMQSLRFAGKLKNLKALIVGGFTEIKDNDDPFGQTVEEIIMQAVQDYSYPVCFDFPAGHMPINRPFILGSGYELVMDEDQICFSLLP
jgi:muramoyltetrapeptide carboxypeptidase